MLSTGAGSAVFVAHAVAGVHRIPAAWLDGYAPSGFRLAAPAEIATWHADRGLTPPQPEGRLFCAQCLRGVGLGATRQRVVHEACASGTVDVRLYSCATCGLDLAAEVQSEPTDPS